MKQNLTHNQGVLGSSPSGTTKRNCWSQFLFHFTRLKVSTSRNQEVFASSPNWATRWQKAVAAFFACTYHVRGMWPVIIKSVFWPQSINLPVAHIRCHLPWIRRELKLLSALLLPFIQVWKMITISCLDNHSHLYSKSKLIALLLL